MLPIDGVCRPDDGSPDPLRPVGDRLGPDADALRDGDVLALDTGVAPPTVAELDALRGSDEPPPSGRGCLRGDAGLLGWLGTRRYENLTLAALRWDDLARNRPRIGRLAQRAAVDPGRDQAKLVLRQRVPGRLTLAGHAGYRAARALRREQLA